MTWWKMSTGRLDNVAITVNDGSAVSVPRYRGGVVNRLNYLSNSRCPALNIMSVIRKVVAARVKAQLTSCVLVGRARWLQLEI